VRESRRVEKENEQMPATRQQIRYRGKWGGNCDIEKHRGNSECCAGKGVFLRMDEGELPSGLRREKNSSGSTEKKKKKANTT